MPHETPPSRPAAESDEALVRRVQAGGAGAHEALTTLLTRHERRIFATCVRMVGDRETARDLAQDAMAKTIEGLGGFDERAKFTTWLTRVVMNACISHLRRQRLRKTASLDAAGPGSNDPEATDAGFAQSAEPPARAGVERDERMRRLDDAMKRLEPEQRAILILRDARDLDYQQIGQALGIAVGTVKSRLFRARAALRAQLESPAGPASEPAAARENRPQA